MSPPSFVEGELHPGGGHAVRAVNDHGTGRLLSQEVVHDVSPRTDIEHLPVALDARPEIVIQADKARLGKVVNQQDPGISVLAAGATSCYSMS